MTFSFGENWKKYLADMHPGAVDATVGYVQEWLGDVRGLTLADVGSGSGLMSLVAHELGARVASFDVDPASVAATQTLWERAGRPSDWAVHEGSILDPTFVHGLGTFDVVVAWGVLHHTGRLEEAISAAAGLVAPGGRLWLALYHRTPNSGRSLRTKRLYNRLPRLAQPAFRGVYAAAKIGKSLIKRRRLPPIREYHSERGMSWWRDIEDWLGGLPYEVASPGEVLARLRPHGFELVRLQDALGEGGNDLYLWEHRESP